MATRTDRLEARIAPERRERIEAAAQLQNTSVSAFVVNAAEEKAAQVLAEFKSTTLPSDYFDEVLEALDAPAMVVPTLAEAARRSEELLKRR